MIKEIFNIKTFVWKILICLFIIMLYFVVWQEIRGIVTEYTVLPQIEYSIDNCENYIEVRQSKPTSLIVYIYIEQKEDYDSFPYTTPGGFYLLLGLLIVTILNGKKIHYQVLVGFHLLFWLFSIIVFYPALCLFPPLLHVNTVGIKYFTPFVTFMVMIMVLSPAFRSKLKN